MLREAGTTQTVEEIGDEIALLASQMSAAMCRWLDLIAEFDERRGWATLGCISCAHWVSWRCGVAPVTAREHVRIALRLRELPLIREAFGRGELSYSKVRALTRVDGITQEAELLDLARHANAAQLERIVAGARAVSREDANAAYDSRSLDVFFDHDGSLVLRGRLPAEVGRLVLSAIERAEVLLDERVERKVTGSEESDAAPPAAAAGPARRDPARPAASARRADALAWLVHTALDAEEGSGRVPTARTEVVVHVDAAALTAAEDPGPLPASTTAIADGPALAVETVRRLCCDGGVVPVLLDDRREVLDVGRRTRAIPPAIRRALRVRDDGCRFPGCDRTRWLQAHHVEHWAHGGSTKLANLVHLCHHHHQLVHEGGFVLRHRADGAMRADGASGADGAFEVLTPDGTVIEDVPPPVADSGAREAWAGGGTMALFPLSAGAPWDLGMAVDAVSEWTAPTILTTCP